MAFFPGQQVSHYRLIEQIGQGGMGVVYRAHDGRLERDVALKVLTAGLLADETARKRFRKEALALSKLNHPNIAIVHDFDSQDGVEFLVMELVPGQALAEKIKMGPFAEPHVVALGTQIASALEEAHQRGVIHRDLKPGNVVVTPKGQAKVLDFGLAQLRPVAASQSQADTVTQTQTAVGTPPYMSPEQLRGEGADARSDVFALGAVLYEAATGKRAFPETNTARLTDAILNHPPLAPRVLNANLSLDLEQIILKCLSKAPRDRYQSAQEVVDELQQRVTSHYADPGDQLQRIRSALLTTSSQGDLQRLKYQIEAYLSRHPHHVEALLLRDQVSEAGKNLASLYRKSLDLGEATPQARVRSYLRPLVLASAIVVAILAIGAWILLRPSDLPAPREIRALAVLPLENQMGDPEQQYFVDGMHEAMIAQLAKVKGLRVISRTSVMRFRDAKLPITDIARELNVDAIIEGSVLGADNQVRITAQLIDARSDAHLWAESYQGELRDVLTLQADIASEIARQINIVLTPEEEGLLGMVNEVNPDAYKAYLKGRFYRNKATDEGLKEALHYYTVATELDPGYAAAYAALAHPYLYGDLASSAGATRARAAAMKALELDESLAEAHVALAQVELYYGWNWEVAERGFLRAIQLDRNSVEAHHQYSHYLMAMGRFDESLEHSRLAISLDPLALPVVGHLTGHYYHARQYEEMLANSRKTLALDEHYEPELLSVGKALAFMGKYPEAISHLEGLAPSSADKYPVLNLKAHTYAMSGKRAMALEVLQKMRGLAIPESDMAYDLATLHAALGEIDQAFEYLEAAREAGDWSLIYARVDPYLDPLRGDIRFHELLRHLGLADDQGKDGENAMGEIPLDQPADPLAPVRNGVACLFVDVPT